MVARRVRDVDDGGLLEAVLQTKAVWKRLSRKGRRHEMG